MSTNFYGGALTKRPTQKSTRFKEVGRFVTSIDGVYVDVSDTSKPGEYTTTSLPGEEFERMRRYSLVMAKWSYPSTAKNSKKWGVSTTAFAATNRLVSNAMYRQVFGEHPTQGTVSAKPYISALLSDAPTPDTFASALALANTPVFATIVDAVRVKNPEMAETLGEVAEYLNGFIDADLDYANGLHDTNKRKRQYATNMYRHMARTINGYSDDLSRRHRKKPGSKPGNKPGTGTKPGEGEGRPTDTAPKGKRKGNGFTVIPIDEYGSPGWKRPYLTKHELVLPHTGLAGRKLIPSNEGRFPKAFHRMVTDPYRRIFQRKTRALGGVVVFDCSGSMSLDDDDIRSVMKAAAGMSIVAYSAGDGEHDETYGNIHLIAKNGRQMRGLPEFPGDNGVDLPALKWAYFNLRLNSKSPVIWVSDGQVTGDGSKSNEALHRETKAFNRAKGIKRVNSPDEAVRLLRKLQKGQRK